jgi:1-deoxy-D-xylulose-5-phosphate reductoisomerase
LKYLSILGSTGSIGRSALEVVSLHDQEFKIVGLAAGRNLKLLAEQVQEFKPEIVSLQRQSDVQTFRNLCTFVPDDIVWGQEGAETVAASSRNEIVLSAITGISGLRPTLAAVRSGARVALANKESMVVGGDLIQKAAAASGAEIIPVDSEHSAVFQCLAKERRPDVRKVILTASGGPFFRISAQEMSQKTPEEALNHPRWKMGRKVTIDSATMMNKGLELLEARWLFNLSRAQLGILIHPQSIVHSLVEMQDGSLLAQLSQTDMKIPIQYALTYPQRNDSGLPPLDLSRMENLEFYNVDPVQFPLVDLAFEALDRDLAFSVALNAANELAVKGYLEKRIGFIQIFEIVAAVCAAQGNTNIQTLDDIFEVDREARERTGRLLKQRL